MNDQKNKQQQPGQGNEKNQNKTGQPGGQSGQMQGNQQQGSQPQGSSQQPGSQQSDKQQMPHKGNMADTKREQPMGSDIENPDRDNDPEKKVNIDDDPEQTKKKVPNMGK